MDSYKTASHLPETLEAIVLVLETLSGREQTRLLEIGRETFRGQLFQALLDRAREHLAAAVLVKAEISLNLARRLLRYSVNDHARAKGLFAIGILWHDFGQLDQATGLYRRAVHFFRRAGVVGGEVRVQARWAQSQAAAGQLRAAIRRYHRARRLAEDSDETRAAAQITNNLGNTYLKAGDYHRAYRAFSTVAAQAEALDYLQLLCLARGNLGLAAFELGRFEEAEVALRAAAVLAQEIGDRFYETSYTGSLGNALRALGRLREAETCFRQALALAREIGDRPSEELALGNLGILLFHMGRMNEAIASLVAARALSLSLAETLHAAQDTYHLGVAYREIGDKQASAAAFQDCLRLAEQASDAALQAGALQALAYQAMNRSDWGESADYLHQAEDLKTQDPDSYNAATLATAWGYWFYQQGQYDEAARHWQEAIELDGASGNRFGLLTDRLNYGGVLVMNGRFREAETVLQKALQQAQTMGLPDEERVIWEGLGLAHQLQGRAIEAQSCYEQAIAAVEAGRGELAAESHRLGFFGTRQGPYVRLVALLVRQEKVGDAWTTVERSRARSFVDALARTALLMPGSLPEAQAAREQELLALLRLRQEKVAQADGRQLPMLLSELAQLRDQLEGLWDDLAIPSPEYVALRRGEPLDWQALQEVLAFE